MVLKKRKFVEESVNEFVVFAIKTQKIVLATISIRIANKMWQHI